MEIPKQLKRKEFRFIKIISGTKRPKEQDWALTNNYKYNDPDFKEYLKDAKAYGVVCGYGNLAIVDADDERVAKDVMLKLPQTFSIKTGSGKWHFYFIIPDLDHKIVLKDEGEGKNKIHFGEVQYWSQDKTGTQALGAGSIHPNKKYYEVSNDSPIQEITKEQLLEALQPYLKEEKKFECNCGMDLDISIVASKISGLDNVSGGLQGSHPIHGSDGGMNFRIDLDPKNVWHCFRCGTGGDALSLIGVLEGIINCEDCKPGYFKTHRNEFRKILSVAEKYGYEGIKPRADTVLLFKEKAKTGDLNVQGIVEYINSQCSFITIRDNTGRKPHIYVYQDGYYRLNGEEIIDTYIKQMFANTTWKAHYKDEIMKYIQTENVVDRDDITSPKHLINCNNGVYDIKSKKLLPHDPKYYFLYKIPRNYKPNAQCPRIMKYFESTLEPDYVKLSQEIFGYCLYFDYPLAAIFSLYGTGGNGKKIWIQLLTALLGKGNVTNKSIGHITKYRFTSALLYGKLANLCGELSDSTLKDTDILKGLSSGDYVQAEFKGRDGFDFQNRAKIITACNSIPYCTDLTDGWYQRQYIIPFLKKFRDTKKEDTELLDKLCTPKELDGLLTWAIEGLVRLLKNKKFTYPPYKEERYLMYQQNVGYFVEKNYIKGNFDDWIYVEDIKEDYKNWCKENKIPIDSPNALGRKLTYEKYTIDKFEEENTWKYIRRYIKKVN